MNEVLIQFIGKFVIVYLDDILIFSETKEEHLTHVRYVMEILQLENLLINMKKCTFMKLELLYLGFVISKYGLKMDPKKIEAIVNWPSPKRIFEVRSFQGFNKNFNGICTLIIDTIRKENQPFCWTTTTEKSF